MCEICGGNGILPFKKNGQVIPFVWLDCSCKLDNPEPEHYQLLSPADFDLPCSDTFRGYSFEYCGQPDPGTIQQEHTPEVKRDTMEKAPRYEPEIERKRNIYRDISA